MPADEKLLSVVGEWVVKAENDLKAAAHTLKLGKDCPTDTACLHALALARRERDWWTNTRWHLYMVLYSEL